MRPAPASARVRRAVDTDRAAWDEFVLRGAGGNLLQCWGWGELKRQFGWDVDRLLAVDDGDSIMGTLQLHSRTAGPVRFAYAPRGPAGADPQAVRALVHAGMSLARRRRALVLKLDPEWREDDPATAALRRELRLRDSWYDVQHRCTYLVDLRDGEEAVLARVKPSTRRHIRHGLRGGITVRSGMDGAAVDAFHGLLQQTAARAGLVIRGPEYHRALVRHVGASCPVVVLLACVDGRAAAGVVAVAAGQRLIYLFGGTAAGVSPDAMYVVQWEAIRWGLAQGCDVYDMWGVPAHGDPAAPGAGYYEFKTRWNGRVVCHLRCQDAPLWPALGPLPTTLERVALRGRPLLT